MKAVVAAFNQEKALVGAFSVITNLRMELFEALVRGDLRVRAHGRLALYRRRDNHMFSGKMLVVLCTEIFLLFKGPWCETGHCSQQEQEVLNNKCSASIIIIMLPAPSTSHCPLDKV